MQLHYQLFEEYESANAATQIPLIIIPGLFGSVANWRSIAKSLSSSRPVYVIDQRNHGRSPHDERNGYSDMVADLDQFMAQHQLEAAHISGHSMGGKVAMLFALEHEEKVTSLCVLDIAPVTYSHSHAPFLEALLEIDISKLKSRAEADRALQQAIPDTGTRLFLLQSLSGSAGNYQWRINLPVLHAYMDEIVGFPQIDRTSPVKTLVIVGADSSYFRPEYEQKVRQLFSASRIETVPNAGHWLHAEQPDKVVEIMEKFLLS
jgi:pimeloyl-ACP methyl ester carboxylesterase